MTTEAHAECRRRRLAYELIRSSLVELLAYLDAPTLDHPALDYVEVHVDREAIVAARAALAVADGGEQ